ncbi:hypothetical protein H2O64_12920 [Kordia sp. YSTF-M3]|uniref:Bacteriocin n=1 Tax=Kordia aestuariivivens TaxID=2759037 RepID=A0ABR7QAL4_9FLAO|nr:hypothetical protein [Kordia aestuariivivens]MBC8755572.1 hypothetical protein [Kordia aestuariivivens]
MKKSNVKLSLNKKRISFLETTEISGGITGKVCLYTNRHYPTCYGVNCVTENDCTSAVIDCS